MSCTLIFLLLFRITTWASCDELTTPFRIGLSGNSDPQKEGNIPIGLSVIEDRAPKEYRRKREIDENDVITSSEIAKYDVTKPSFWWSQFQNELSHEPQSSDTSSPTPISNLRNTIQNGNHPMKPSDVDHVVSESGKSYRGSSGANWFISSKSFLNVNNFSSEHKSERRFTEHKTLFIPPKRHYDQNHVVSQVPGFRMTTSSDLANSNLSPNSENQKLNSEPNTQVDNDSKPKIETRYFLLKSGRVAAINVTVHPKGANSKPGDSQKPPVPFFGGRIRPKAKAESSVVIPPPTTKSPVTETVRNDVRTSNHPQNFRSPKRIDLPLPPRSIQVVVKAPSEPEKPKQIDKNRLTVPLVKNSHVVSKVPESRDGVFKAHRNSSIPPLAEDFFFITFDSEKRSHLEYDDYSYEYYITPEPPKRSRLAKAEVTLPGYVTTPTLPEKVMNSRWSQPTITIRRELADKPSTVSPPGLATTWANTNKGKLRIGDQLPQKNDKADLGGPVTERIQSKRPGSVTTRLPKFRHEFVRIVTAKPLLISTTVGDQQNDINLQSPSTRRQPKRKIVTTTPREPNTARRPRYREFTPGTVSPVSPKAQKPTITDPPDTTTISDVKIASPKPTRTPRQDRFHFRNSVSFQLMPPGSLTDRRSLSSSTSFNETDKNANRSTKRDQTIGTVDEEFVPIMFFEPTRKKLGTLNTEEEDAVKIHNPFFVTETAKLRNRGPLPLQTITAITNPSPIPSSEPATNQKPKPVATPAKRIHRHDVVTTTPILSDNSFTTSKPATFESISRTKSSTPFALLPNPPSSPSDAKSSSEDLFNRGTQKEKHREGRNFKHSRIPGENLNSEPQIEANGMTLSTTRKPFRVYYFEPRRRKSKPRRGKQVENSEAIKDDFTTTMIPTTPKKVFIPSTRQTTIPTTRLIPTARPIITTRLTTRQPRQFQDATKAETTPTSAPSTTRNQVTTRKTRRGSPFIQHKPNVKLIKSSTPADTNSYTQKFSNLPSVEYVPFVASTVEPRRTTLVAGQLSAPLVKALQDLAQNA